MCVCAVQVQYKYQGSKYKYKYYKYYLMSIELSITDGDTFRRRLSLTDLLCSNYAVTLQN